VLVHVVTSKGKGYAPAEANRNTSTGGCLRPGDRERCRMGRPRLHDVFADAIVALARENPKVVAITAAMCGGRPDEIPRGVSDRFFDVGIAEAHAVTFAAGLAREGKIPVVAIYSTSCSAPSTRSSTTSASRSSPWCSPSTAVASSRRRATHQGLFDLSFLRQIPKCPHGAARRGGAGPDASYRGGAGRPVAIRYPRGSGPGWRSLSARTRNGPMGKGELLAEGKDVLLIGSVRPWRRASKRRGVAEAGRFRGGGRRPVVKPLDTDLLLPLVHRSAGRHRGGEPPGGGFAAP